VKKLENALLNDPYKTNAELAEVVNNKISARAAGNYISKSPLEFKLKLETPDVEASFAPETVKEGLAFIRKIKQVPDDDRVYVDETWLSSGVRRRKGRFAKGRSTAVPRNRKYPRHVAICAIYQNAWLHPAKILKQGSIKTEEFENYVRYTLAPRLWDGVTVLWDRLGRSGRAKNPKGLHFSPKAAGYITNRGAKLEILPPYGKYLDPIEPLFGDTKRIFDKKLVRLGLPSKVTFEDKVKLWHQAEKSISPDMFKRAYKERANGQELKREYVKRGLLKKH
jgi:hypothetical protein